MNDLRNISFKCESRALQAVKRIQFPQLITERAQFELILERAFAYVFKPLLEHFEKAEVSCRWFFLHYHSPTFGGPPIRVKFSGSFGPNDKYWSAELKRVLETFYDRHEEIRPYRMFQLLLTDSEKRSSIRISVEDDSKTKIENDALVISSNLVEVLQLNDEEWQFLIEGLKEENNRSVSRTVSVLKKRREAAESKFQTDVEQIGRYFKGKLKIKSNKVDQWNDAGFLRMIQTTLILKMNPRLDWNHLDYIPLENPLAPSSGVVFTTQGQFPEGKFSQLRSIVNNTMNLFYAAEISRWEVTDRESIMKFQRQAPHAVTYAAFASLCKKSLEARLGVPEDSIAILQCEPMDDGFAVKKMGTEEDRFLDQSYIQKISRGLVQPLRDSENIYVFEHTDKEGEKLDDDHFISRLYGHSKTNPSILTFLILRGSTESRPSYGTIGCIVISSDRSLEQYKNYLDLFASSAALKLATLQLHAAQLKRHFSPVLVDNMMEQGFQNVIGDVVPQRDITIMFIDIRQFSKAPLNLTAKRKALYFSKTISQFKRIVEYEVLENDGILDKFIGDGAVAFFGFPPRKNSNSFSDAAKTAEKIQHRIKDELDELLDVGISIYHANKKGGEVYIGNVGGQDRVDFTVMGDAVNLASRLVDAAGRVIDHQKHTVIGKRSEILCYNESKRMNELPNFLQSVVVNIDWIAIKDYLSSKVEKDITELRPPICTIHKKD